jgi:hypothetical protein
LHRAIDSRFAGTVAGTAPSTALVTHTAVFGEWSAPHPFPAAS